MKKQQKMQNLIVIHSTKNTILKIGTFNLANSLLDEKSETTNFFLREKEIISTIDKMNPDILALNELRPYSDHNTKEIYYPSNFLGKIKEYDHFYDYINGSALAFGIGLIYKRSSVYPIKTIKHWLSNTPTIPSDSWGNGFGRIIMGVKFLPIDNGKIIINTEPIWVFVTHLGLGEKEKNECVNLIPKLIKKEVENDHYVIMGHI
ncbi:Hypothetical protein KVN_LOCUS3 [uncultured virus]|nr:Hypothetical protein KVN_LOCUS3 [uncultured virus]